MFKKLLIFILIFFHSNIGNGFLYTPKVEIFLSVMKSPNEFSVKWDKVNNNPGFSYATNQYGKFINENKIRWYNDVFENLMGKCAYQLCTHVSMMLIHIKNKIVIDIHMLSEWIRCYVLMSFYLVIVYEHVIAMFST